MLSPKGQKIQLKLPLTDIHVNQEFGQNYVDFYQKMGLKGHNGIDFRTRRRCPVKAAHDGTITWSGMDGNGGIGISIVSSLTGLAIKTLYYHLDETVVEHGQEVKAGELIGYSDNTGLYTTGDHLHFGLKEVIDCKTVNYNNGYKGSINPAPYFKKDWDKPNAYHRYGREKQYWPEFWFRFAPINVKNRWTEGGRYVHKTLKRIGFATPLLNTAQANAIIYGGWGLPDVLNSSLYLSGWGFIKKTEFENRVIPFKR